MPPRLIDRTATQYQDVVEHESALRMDPQGKKPNELRAKEFCDRRKERKIVKDVPGSDHVNAARRGSDGRDGRQRREPLVAAADDFSAPVRQHEVDSGFNGLAVDAEQFVGCGVPAGRVRAHAKAFRDRLETLGLFADTRTRAPPPRLMNKRPVRWVHQPNDAVIDVAG